MARTDGGRRGGRAFPLALLILLAAAGAGAVEDPLAGLEISGKGLGWGGLRLGMSFVQAERRAGSTLPLTERAGARCGSFAAGAEIDGLSLTLGFSGSRPGDKIETIFVRFEGYQVAASAADLVASLRSLAPNAVYRPDPTGTWSTEAEDPAPVYFVDAGKASYAVQLRPRDGILLARRDCVG
ncbi:MAG: hypothetical protein KDB94_10650 [Acidobacteria bacterium]|nr:hypothetical protein [Acidobacteriota bacterium]